MRSSQLKNRINTFLYYGYLPHVPDYALEQSWTEKRSNLFDKTLTDLNEQSLIEKGKAALRTAYRDIKSKGTHILSLSGGLDSRAILGGLIDAELKDNIIAVTYGTPGTYDFDIGKKIAKEVGVEHEALDLKQIQIEQHELEIIAQQSDTWFWLFDYYYINKIYKKFGTNPIYWSGHVGDDLAGSYIKINSSKSWDDALRGFVVKNQFAKSEMLTHPDFDPIKILPSKPILSDTILDYDDQIHMILRQESYMRPLLMPGGYKYKLPFIDYEWVRFILSVPRQYRFNMNLYKKILISSYPELFDMPTKEKKGLSLVAPDWQFNFKKLFDRSKLVLGDLFPNTNWSINPNVNYIDFENGIRYRDDLKEIVYSNIMDLKKRSIVDWIDIEYLWDSHQKEKANHAFALTLLTSLEIFLKVNDN